MALTQTCVPFDIGIQNLLEDTLNLRITQIWERERQHIE